MSDPAPWARRTSEGWLLALRVQPGARRSQVVGTHGEELKVQISAPPVDGKANVELVRLVARELGVSRAAVRVRRGQTGRSKVVAVDDPDHVAALPDV